MRLDSPRGHEACSDGIKLGFHFWEAIDVDTVALHPTCDRIEVWVAHTVEIPENPRSFDQGVFDKLKTRAHGLRHLSSHVFKEDSL